MPFTQALDSLDWKPVTPYSIDLISTEEALSALEGDWNRLSECGERNVFASFAWYSAWTRFYASQQGSDRFHPEVLVFRRNGTVEGIAPLVHRVTSRFGVRVRRLEFVTIHADYNQLVIGADRVGLTRALVEFLLRTQEQWDAVDLRDLPDGEAGVDLIKNALSQFDLPHRAVPEKHPCPYLPINNDAGHQIALLSGHVRRVLRKRIANAERARAFVRLIEHPEREPGLLEKMIELERKKYMRSEFSPFVALHESVFRELFAQLGPRNWLCVALLERDTEPVAFQLSFRCGNTLWDYNKAYDRAFSQLAPGTLLVLSMLNYGFKNGYDEYDFLRGEEDYKKVWSTDCHRRTRLLIWNKSGASRFGRIVYYVLKPVVYRALRKRGEW